MIISLRTDLIEMNAVEAGDLASDAQVQKGDVRLLAHCIERLGLQKAKEKSESDSGRELVETTSC